MTDSKAGAQHSAIRPTDPVIPERFRSDVEVLWAYHDLRHELRPCDVGIGLGSHDLGVAIIAVQLFKQGLFPRMVFTGANAPTTVDRFPKGEAAHYTEYAIDHGVPADLVLTEPAATNTAENITLSREVLQQHALEVRSVLLMCRPYQQRRAYATCKKVWPEVDVLCASLPLPLDDYVTAIGDVTKVIDMLVGDTQRIGEYARRGFAISQEVPPQVKASFERLVDAGYTSRLVPGAST